MSRVEYDEIREERIEMEIIVDTYNPEEQAMGWYYYLGNNLDFSFKEKWFNRRGKSKDREVVVQKMSPEDECQNEMFVEVLYGESEAEDVFSALLHDIEPVGVVLTPKKRLQTGIISASRPRDLRIETATRHPDAPWLVSTSV